MDHSKTIKVKNEFDLLVIGGGITGATVAYEAASRGLKIALVEKSDFGGATSAATSKMIHGGFRYLTKLEIGLVRESLRERRILMNIAPNFVHPLPFVFTHYKNDKYPGWMVKAGMFFYDMLSYDKNNLWDEETKMPSHKNISKTELLTLEPEVLSENLIGGSLYYDGMNFCPERLTLAFIQSAVKMGATVANYSEVTAFLFNDINGERIVTGARIRDRLNGKENEIKSKLTINCAGPWADLVLNKLSGQNDKKTLKRSEGIHFITKKKVSEFVITTTTKSGRHCFFVPWRNHTLIGTTDKEFLDSPDEYVVSKSAVKELLDEINPVFGNSEKITLEDVKFAYGGLRPLVETDTKESYASSRKYEISTHENDTISGLITVEGGKYTTSRSLAQKVINKAFRLLKRPYVASETAKKHLAGSEIKNLKSFIQEKQLRYPLFEKAQIEYLIKLYGNTIDLLMKIAGEDPSYSEKLNEDGEIPAQVIFAIRHEMAKTLPDILLRRTGLGTLGHPGNNKLKLIADITAKEAGWNEMRKSEEIQKAEAIYRIKN